MFDVTKQTNVNLKSWLGSQVLVYPSACLQNYIPSQTWSFFQHKYILMQILMYINHILKGRTFILMEYFFMLKYSSFFKNILQLGTKTLYQTSNMLPTCHWAGRAPPQVDESASSPPQYRFLSGLQAATGGLHPAAGGGKCCLCHYSNIYSRGRLSHFLSDWEGGRAHFKGVLREREGLQPSIMCAIFFYSQAEAVLLRGAQHFLLQLLTRLSKQRWTGEGDGPLILPLKLILKLELEDYGKMNDWEQSDVV